MLFLVLCLPVLILNLNSYGIEYRGDINRKAENLAKEPIIPVIPDDDDDNYRPYIPPVDTPSINTPNDSDIWEHGEHSKQITWDGLDGRYVKIALYMNGSLISDISGWEENDGSYFVSVSSLWGSGDGFQIRIENNSDPADIIWSDEFRIMAPINISAPGYGTRWSHGQCNAEVRWSGSPGSLVSIKLYNSNKLVTTLVSTAPNNGSYIIPHVSSSWGTGDNYSLLIADDLGNEYESSDFRIDAIHISYPNSGTVWHDGATDLEISWTGGTRIVSIDLYRGSTKVLELARLIDNTGNYTWSGSISSSIGGSSQYEIRVTDDNGNVGRSERFNIQISDNSIHGAQQIEEYSTGEFESEDDLLDYWKIDAEVGFGYLIETNTPNINITIKDNLGNDIQYRSGNGQIFWIADASAYYYIRVSRSSAEAANEYQMTCKFHDTRQSTPTSMNVDHSYSFLGPTDVQILAIEVPNDRKLEVNVDSDDNIIIQLYSEQNTLLISSNTSELQFTTPQSPRDGRNTYYIVLTGSVFQQQCEMSSNIDCPEYRRDRELFIGTTLIFGKNSIHVSSGVDYEYRRLDALCFSWAGIANIIEVAGTINSYSGDRYEGTNTSEVIEVGLGLAMGLSMAIDPGVSISGGVGGRFPMSGSKSREIPIQFRVYEYINANIMVIPLVGSNSLGDRSSFGIVTRLYAEYSDEEFQFGVGVGIGGSRCSRVDN